MVRWRRSVRRSFNRSPGCTDIHSTAVIQYERHLCSSSANYGRAGSHRTRNNLYGECHTGRAILQFHPHVRSHALGEHRSASRALHTHESIQRCVCLDGSFEHQCAHTGLLDDVCGRCERCVVGFACDSGDEYHAARNHQSWSAVCHAEHGGLTPNQRQHRDWYFELFGQWSSGRAQHQCDHGIDFWQRNGSAGNVS